jgi:hypothetical protein
MCGMPHKVYRPKKMVLVATTWRVYEKTTERDEFELEGGKCGNMYYLLHLRLEPLGSTFFFGERGLQLGFGCLSWLRETIQ